MCFYFISSLFHLLHSFLACVYSSFILLSVLLSFLMISIFTVFFFFFRCYSIFLLVFNFSCSASWLALQCIFFLNHVSSHSVMRDIVYSCCLTTCHSHDWDVGAVLDSLWTPAH
jgi:hypothetical protein